MMPPTSTINIQKRDTTIEPFNEAKIQSAIEKAIGPDQTIAAVAVTSDVIKEIQNGRSGIVNVETIQDIVEHVLMMRGFYDAAKRYILYRQQRTEHRQSHGVVSIKNPQPIDTPWGEIGYITYKRTYSRRIENGDGGKEPRTEEYEETIMRVLNACQTQLKMDLTKHELEQARRFFLELKCSVAGRFLWQLGTQTVETCGLTSLQNCAFTLIDEPIRPFLWIFDMLMLGCGVGFNIQKKYIDKLPLVIDADIRIVRKDTKDADYIIPDSREGWVKFLGQVLDAFFVKGKGFTYSTVCVRSKGTPIKGFGGVASGPEDLCKGVAQIETIMTKRRGQKLTSVDCLDIVNIIASIVVSGNVRRCLPGDAMVHTRGGLVPIKDVKPGMQVLTFDGYRTVKEHMRQGKQALVQIVTEDGVFRCTGNHKMATVCNEDTVSADKTQKDGYVWKQASDLKPGTDALITTQVAVEGTPQTLPDTNNVIDTEMAWLFGYSTLRGHILGTGKKVWINALNKAAASRAEKQIRRLLTDVPIDIDENNNVTCASDIIVRYFSQHVIRSPLATSTPECITLSPKDVRLAYIAGIIDGTTEELPKIIHSASLAFVRNIQTQAYSCGLDIRLTQKTDSSGLKTWCLEAHSDHALDIISKIPELQKEIPGYVPRYDTVHMTHAVSKVVSVTEYQGEVETYDIAVEGRHEFFCDGYLTHNSACIAIGDPDDIPYLQAKRWDLGNIPNWRAMSNNSVACEDIAQLPDEFWDGYKGLGEPYGLINLELSKRVGRLKDGDKYPDPDVCGYNPCAEISLNNNGTCCLSEIFLPNIKSLEELKEVGTLLYRICKHSLTLHCHHKETEDIVHQDMRMGMGITGYLQCTDEQKAWLSPLYDHLRSFDVEYSAKLGVPKSIKLTCAKPSGCRPGPAITTTKNGIYTLAELLEMNGHPDGDEWCDFKEKDLKAVHGDSKSQKITKTYRNGLSDTLKIKLSYNIELESTPNHRWWISKAYDQEKRQFVEVNQWKEARDIQPDDIVEVVPGVYDNTVDQEFKRLDAADIKQPSHITPDIAWLIGYLWGNGTFSLEHSLILFMTSCSSHIEKLHRVFKDAFGIETSIESLTSSGVKVSSVVTVSSVALWDFFKLNGISMLNTDTDSTLTNIPRIVRESSVEVILAFIAGFTDVDGHFDKKQTMIYTTQHQFSMHFQDVALACGLNFSRSREQNENMWLLCLSPHSVPERFDMFRKHSVNNHTLPLDDVKEILGRVTEITKGTPVETYDIEVENENWYYAGAVKSHNTLSLLAGVTPGAHPAIYRHFIRRIRISSNSPLIDVCKAHGYHTEYQINFDGTEDRSTIVVEFPCCFPDNARLAKDMTAIDELEVVKEIQTNWSDNAVSCTIYYRMEELEGIKEWLRANYRDCVKTVSFLLHNDHGFKQAPYEEITEERYKELKAHVRPIKSSSMAHVDVATDDIDQSLECVGGSCPIR